MLKTRKIVKFDVYNNSSYGGYQGIYGQGASNFIYGADALAQILTHQILTIRGELKDRTDYGIDWFKKDIGSNTKILLDTQIKNLLINNFYVNNILLFESSYKDDQYSLNIKLATTEGLLQITI